MLNIDPIIRYPNQSRAHVVIYEAEAREPFPLLSYWAECKGCLVTRGNEDSLDGLEANRSWAAKHAESCTALPQETIDIREDPGYEAQVAKFLHRAVGVVNDGGRQSDIENYLRIAEVYATMHSTFLFAR